MRGLSDGREAGPVAGVFPFGDIYLPEWLARYNKQIFGPLYAVGVAYLVAMYLMAG
jgi:hypothetical protein